MGDPAKAGVLSGNIGQLIKSKMKESAQRRCKHCMLAVVRQSQKFSPHCRPPSRECRTAKI